MGLSIYGSDYNGFGQGIIGYTQSDEEVAQNMYGVKKCFKKNTTEKSSMIEEKDPRYFETLHEYIPRGVFYKNSSLVTIKEITFERIKNLF